MVECEKLVVTQAVYKCPGFTVSRKFDSIFKNLPMNRILEPVLTRPMRTTSETFISTYRYRNIG